MTVFEFLESADLADPGWGNSIQKANRLYSKLNPMRLNLNIFDDYNLMTTWLIANYGGPARIVGDIVSNLSKKSAHAG